MKDFHYSTHYFLERGKEKELESDQSGDEEEDNEDTFQEEDVGEEYALEQGGANSTEAANVDETNVFTEGPEASDDHEKAVTKESEILFYNTHVQNEEHGREGRVSEEVEDIVQENQEAAMQ